MPSDAPIYPISTSSGNMEVNTSIRQVSEAPISSTSNSNSESTLSPSLSPRPPEEKQNNDRISNYASKQIDNQFCVKAPHNEKTSCDIDIEKPSETKSGETKNVSNRSSHGSDKDFMIKDSNENIAAKSEDKEESLNFSAMSSQVDF